MGKYKKNFSSFLAIDLSNTLLLASFNLVQQSLLKDTRISRTKPYIVSSEYSGGTVLTEHLKFPYLCVNARRTLQATCLDIE